MIVNIHIKHFREGLSKLCKVASITSTDSYTSQLRFVAKGKTFFGEAINDTKTQTLAIKFDENSCSIEEEGSICIPAKALQQTIELLLGDTLEISTEGNLVNLKSLPNNKKDEIQSIEGFDVSQWQSGGKVESDVVVQLERSFFLNVGKFTANGCSTDKSKAPLTAIHIRMYPDGKIECTATDYVRISLYDSEHGIKDGNLENNFAFMLPTDVAKKIPLIFDKNIDVINAKLNEKRIALSAGNTVFIFATEAGLDRYPPLRSYLMDDMDIYSVVKTPELTRITGLLSAVAAKSACKISFFSNDQIVFETQENRNKSRHILEGSIKLSNTEATLPESIKIAIYDLLSALSVHSSEELNIGLVSIKNNAVGYLFEIRKVEDDVTSRQIILKAREVVPDEEPAT